MRTKSAYGVTFLGSTAKQNSKGRRYTEIRWRNGNTDHKANAYGSSPIERGIVPGSSVNVLCDGRGSVLLVVAR